MANNPPMPSTRSALPLSSLTSTSYSTHPSVSSSLSNSSSAQRPSSSPPHSTHGASSSPPLEAEKSQVPIGATTLRYLNPSMVAGAGAGLISSVVTCPLDVVKTRLQAQHLGKGQVGYEGVYSTFRTIARQSGLKGFYRGLGPTVLGYLPTWAIYFSVYDEVKSRLRHANPDGLNGERVKESIWIHIVAAMMAGGTGTLATNPLWVIKTRFMAQSVKDPNQKRYKHTLDAILTIYKQEGMRGFYRGLTPSLMGVSHVAVHFPLYEQLKYWASEHQPNDLDSTLSPSVILICSALSKIVASVTTYPHEVLRTRLQIQRTHSPPPSSTSASASTSRSPAENTSSSRSSFNQPYHVRSGGALGVRQGDPGAGSAYKGLWRTISQIRKESGWSGFYRGLSINLVRTVPASAVTMLTYELIMRYLTHLPDP